MPTPAPEVAADSGKKKKLPPHLAKLQKQQEDLRRQRELDAEALIKARADAEEAERREAEDSRLKEEQKALKKQKEKERIEQLKKEGKFLTKAQKEEKARNEKKLQQMLAAGIKVGPSETGAAEPKKKAGFEKKKKSKLEQKVCDIAVMLNTRLVADMTCLGGGGGSPRRSR